MSDEEYDACVRVLDALFSDEMRDLYVYGREGIEYEVAEDGSKVPLFPAAADSAWRETYGVAWTANTVESMNYYSISAIYSSAAFTEEQKAQYSADFINAFNEIDEKYLCKLDYSPTSFVTATDEITNATNECAEKQKNPVCGSGAGYHLHRRVHCAEGSACGRIPVCDRLVERAARARSGNLRPDL